MPNAEDFSVGYNAWCRITKPAKINYVDRSDATTNDTSIGGWMLPVISGNISRSLNVPTVNSYFLPDQLSIGSGTSKHSEVKSQIQVGYGVYSFQGSLDFEMTNGMTGLLDVNDDKNGEYGVFFRRNSIFHVQFFDGKRTCTVRNCAWSDFSISGSPNSAVRASMNFQSNNGYRSDLDIQKGNVSTGASFDSEDFLLPYWRCGSSDVLDFSLSISRPVTPVFLNNNLYVPSYLRVGLASVSLNMTCMSPKSWDAIIYIGDKKITFNGARLQTYDYQMTTLSDVGNKTYTWTSISLENAVNPIFKIEDAGEKHKEPTS